MKTFVSSNYLIQGIDELLHEDCILQSYALLLPFRQHLVQGLLSLGCKTRDDCLVLPDDALLSTGLPGNLVGLFRRFLLLYDDKGKGIKDIPDVENRSAEEILCLN